MENQPIPPIEHEFETHEALQWTAQDVNEYTHGPAWYAVFAGIVVVMLGLSIWAQMWMFAVLIPIMAIALIMHIRRPVQTHQYAVSGSGIYIDGRLYPFSTLKSFGVVPGSNGASDVIRVIPVKRFNFSTTLFFPREIGEELVDTLAQYLPMANVEADMFDRILFRLKL